MEGQSVEAGVGIDRQAGVYRVSTDVVFANRIVNVAGIARRDLTLVASLDRSFAVETRTVCLLAIYNPGEGSTFARAIGSMSVRDNVALEASGALFTGSGDDVFARFSTRDFLYLRLRVFY